MITASGPKRKRWGLKALRLFGHILFWPLLLLAVLGVLLYLPPVQNMLRKKAVDFLLEKTGTEIRIERIALRYPIGLTVKGLFVGDALGDTLLHAGTVKARVDLTALLGQRIVLGGVLLEDVTATVVQAADSTFNFDHIIAAFTSAENTDPPSDSASAWGFAIEDVELHNIDLVLDLRPSDFAMDLQLGRLAVDLDEFDAQRSRYHVDDLRITNTVLAMRTASGPPTPDTYPALVNPMASFDIRFHSIGLEHVFFSMMTTNTGDSLWVEAGEVMFEAEEMDLSKQRIKLGDVDLEQVRFGMLTATIDTSLADTIPGSIPQNDDGFRYWLRDWDLAVDDLGIEESSFELHIGSVATPVSLFDPQHLRFRSITFDAEDLALNNELLSVSVDELSATMGPEDTPLSLALELDAKPTRIDLKDAEITLADISLEFRASLRPQGLRQLLTGTTQVPLDIRVQSTLDLERLSPLLTTLDIDLPPNITSREVIDTRLSVLGTIASPDTIVLRLRGDQGTVANVVGHGKDLLNWPRSNGTLVVDRFTMGPLMRQFVEGFTPSGTALPQRLTMSGRGTVDNGDLSAHVDLESDLGDLQGEVSATNWEKDLPDAFVVDLQLIGGDMATLLGDTAWNKVDLHVFGEGKALNSPERWAHLDVEPGQLTYKSTDLSNLAVQLEVVSDSIHVRLEGDDEPMALTLEVDGTWSETDGVAGTLGLHMEQLGLGELGLTTNALDLAGNWSGEFNFDTAWYGRFKLLSNDFLLQDTTADFLFERIAISGMLGSDSTALDVDSDALTLMYHTNTAVDSLIPRTSAKMKSIFTSDTTFVAQPGRYMLLSATLPRPEWLTGLVIPDLEEIQLERFEGRYNGDADAIELDLDVPVIKYNGISAEGVRINMESKGPSVDGDVQVARIERDSISIEGLGLTATTEAGVVELRLRIQPEEAETLYLLGIALRTTDGIRELHVADDLILNGEPWTAEQENSIRFTQPVPTAENMVLQGEGQRIALITEGSTNRLEITNLHLNTLARIVALRDSSDLASGTINGSILIQGNEEVPLKADVSISSLRIMDNGIGTLRIAAAQPDADHLSVEAVLDDEANRIQAKALIGIGAASGMRASADLDLQDLGALQPFFSNYLYTLSGGMDGTISYERTGSQSALAGNLDMEGMRVGVVLTGSTYYLPNEQITMNDRGIHLDNVQLIDSVGNKFLVDGDLRLAEFEDPQLDLTVRTPRFRLISSTYSDNPMFYGQLYASSDLKFKGPITRPTISGKFGVLDGTDFSVVLPGSKVELIGSDGVVVFTDDLNAVDTLTVVARDRSLQDSIQAKLPGVDLDLQMHVNKAARFAVVLDPTTGDQATFSGEGDLEFKYKGDEMYLKGPFIVDQGGYTLEFYGLVKKRFDLVKGSSFRWSGDPMSAVMDVQAIYTAKSAPYPLVAGTNSGFTELEKNKLRQPIPFAVTIDINGEMTEPSIVLGLAMDRDLRNSYPQVADRIEQLTQPGYDEERNRQVFGLLVMNSFIEDESTGASGSSGIATSAARNSVNGLLTDQMNKLTGDYIKGVDVSFGVNTYDQSGGGQTYQRTSLDYKVSKRVLDDRLSFEVDGSVGLDESRSQASAVSNNRAAQYAILYDLTADGRFRIRGFQENAYDLFDGEIRNSGIALMYTQEFEENERSRSKARRERGAQKEKEQREKGDKVDE